jgi:alkanesulfonate monooxygenase SsuD/methylene tetrahydromethanopterin reductase-like flavin-dependent oxidoreductase (luciferase family)
MSPADAEAAFAGYNDAERATIEALRRKAMVGTASQVAARLHELAAKFALDEIVINTWTHDPGARHRSYELLAKEFGIGA